MIDLQAITRMVIRGSQSERYPKIAAINALRRSLGVGLREAKDMVEDAYMCGPVPVRREARPHCRG